MKLLKICIFLFSFCFLFSLVGCGEKELPSAKIVRDDSRTGGSLSFVYDERDRIVYIGGKDEYIQFSAADDILGLSEGNRVGLKVFTPDESLDVSYAKLEMNGVNYNANEFMEYENGNIQRFFVIKPLFSNEVKENSFKITWEEGSKEQEYKIIVKDGTKFLEK